MSANNELRIERYPDGYRVSNVDVDAGGGFFIQDAPVASLEEAVRLANAYLAEQEVEYGLHIVTDRAGKKEGPRNPGGSHDPSGTRSQDSADQRATEAPAEAPSLEAEGS